MTTTLAIRCLRVFSMMGAIFGVSIAMQQQKIAVTRSSDHVQEPYKQILTNYYDAQYTAQIVVGSKTLKAILDTGSFELNVLSTDCKECGRRSNLYVKSTGKEVGNKGISTFGSGTLYTSDVKDAMAIGPLKLPEQSFWVVTEAEMPILEEDSFAAIFGLGPPGSALKIAQLDAREVHKQFNKLVRDGSDVTPEIEDIVERYDGSVKHARQTKPIVDALGMMSFSVCFYKKSGSNGFNIWYDNSVQMQPSKFAHINVVGSVYWSASMTNVRVGTPTVGNVPKNSEFAKPTSLACDHRPCSAVLDTGSTLLSAPSGVVDKIWDMVDAWLGDGGNCRDLSNIPDLEFELGGHKLSLPAESYIGEIYGDLNDGAADFMPRYTRTRALRHLNDDNDLTCQPLILALDTDTGNGPMWILGMPFFRKYYTNFQFDHRYQGASISVSVADAKCEPGHSPEAAMDLLMGVRPSERRPAQLRVDASKIRVPRVAAESKAPSATKMFRSRVDSP